MVVETSLRLLPFSDLHSRLKGLEDAARACRAELQRRPTHCQKPPPPQPAAAGSSCMLKLEDFPSELLVKVAETLGNPLALLVSKAHLSKAFCKAARAAQATLTTLNLACCSKMGVRRWWGWPRSASSSRRSVCLCASISLTQQWWP